MRYITLKAWLPLILLLSSSAAEAVGLGRLNVLSAMGQPLRAEIELLSVQKDELASLAVRLATPDAYRRANLQYGVVAASVRLSIDKRADGRPFVRVSSTQAVNDPFVDLLIELSWSSGRLMREYTALLDPPGVAPESAAAPVAAPAARPAAAPVPLAAAPAPRAPAAAAAPGTYGPIQRGETLGAIARSLKSDDVTLEQMLVGLFRSNPDAFIRKNLNLVRSGKILRVPDRQEIAAIPRAEAMREYRAQVTDWNSYRATLADTAGAARQGGAAASGRITGRVADQAAGDPKDVVRLSKGETPAGGKPQATAERIRGLEEELVAREKALAEARERVAQLEKTIKDMQRLAEIKNPTMAAAQKQAQDAMAAPKPAADATPQQKPEAAKPAAAPKPAVKPVPKAKAAPPPPEPSLLDTLSDPLYLAAGGGVIALLLGYLMMRRRRRGGDDTEVEMAAPAVSTPAAMPAATASAPVPATAAMPDTSASDEVDPLEEARVYMSHGRDAQAEAVLTEALEKKPQREELHVKLLEIYAARKDKAAFGKYAEAFNDVTGGQGANWTKVAAMGYALDADNPLYAAGREIVAAAPPAAEPAAVDLDFNLDVPGHEDGGEQRTAAAEEAQSSGPMMPDFNLDEPAPQTRTPPAPAAESPDAGGIDFSVELPVAAAPQAPAPAARATDDKDAGLDFKLDVSGLDLDLGGDSQKAPAEGADKDAHWHDVQTKFDLVRAYEEMGDRDGARQILEEVVREGDAEQQAQARKLLDASG